MIEGADRRHWAKATEVDRSRVQPRNDVAPPNGEVIEIRVSQYVLVRIRRSNGDWLMSVASRIRDRKGVGR